MTDSSDSPKILVDSDWKAQAQAEKAKLAEKDAKAQPAAGSASPGDPPSPGQLPPASFETLVSTMVTQAIYGLGGIADPRTGQPVIDLELARHQIDLLGVLQSKTEGNLDDDEKDLLGQTLYELRSRYVQISTAVRNGAVGGAPSDPLGGPATPPPPA
ncbi:MAG: DUF1844 domain-containing protein [Planctomycetota bacterium]